jgi:hypothetical protein
MSWYNKIEKRASAMFSSTGIIKIEPKLARLKTDPKGWIVIMADRELTRYYVEQFNFAHRAKDIQIMMPAWGGHISVARGEDIKDRNYLLSLNNKRINFNYDSEVKGNGNHFWLEVECQEAENIREKLGLSRKPYFDFHLTIGVKKG